jgi:hypothetical protein
VATVVQEQLQPSHPTHPSTAPSSIPMDSDDIGAAAPSANGTSIKEGRSFARNVFNKWNKAQDDFEDCKPDHPNTSLKVVKMYSDGLEKALLQTQVSVAKTIVEKYNNVVGIADEVNFIDWPDMKKKVSLIASISNIEH